MTWCKLHLPLALLKVSKAFDSQWDHDGVFYSFIALGRFKEDVGVGFLVFIKYLKTQNWFLLADHCACLFVRTAIVFILCICYGRNAPFSSK